MNIEGLALLKKFRRKLTDDGLETGLWDIIADYSSAPKKFYCSIPADEVYMTYSVDCFMRITTTFGTQTYGNLAGALTNGINIYTEDTEGNVIFELTSRHLVKCNDDYLLYADKIMPNDNATSKIIKYTWNGKDREMPLGVCGNAGHRFVVEVQDNFTGLSEHKFQIWGVSNKGVL